MLCKVCQEEFYNEGFWRITCEECEGKDGKGGNVMNGSFESGKKICTKCYEGILGRHNEEEHPPIDVV